MWYMLETNVISDLIKNPSGKTAERVLHLAPNTICTTVVVAGELRCGAAKKASVSLSRRVEQFLDAIPVLPLDAACADVYGKIRTTLEKKGLPIGVNDLWIAAHALVSNMTLVTHNRRQFKRVKGLMVEDWLG